MFELVPKTCSNASCGATFNGLSFQRPSPCPTCVDAENAQRLAVWRSREIEQIEMSVTAKLTSYGLSPAEAMHAALDQIPIAIKRLVPRDDAVALIGVDALPTTFHGFGLSGGQGAGKTFAMAAMLKSRIREQLLAALQRMPAAPDEFDTQSRPWHALAGFRWVNWPEAAAWLKTSAMQDRGAAIIEGMITRWLGAPLLVLDDLGRERNARGTGYTEDYASGVLDRVVDHRTRFERPLLWTTNLPASAIAQRYGASLASRLLGYAPLIEIPTLPDRRLSAER